MFWLLEKKKKNTHTIFKDLTPSTMCVSFLSFILLIIIISFKEVLLLHAHNDCIYSHCRQRGGVPWQSFSEISLQNLMTFILSITGRMLWQNVPNCCLCPFKGFLFVWFFFFLSFFFVGGTLKHTTTLVGGDGDYWSQPTHAVLWFVKQTKKGLYSRGTFVFERKKKVDSFKGHFKEQIMWGTLGD